MPVKLMPRPAPLEMLTIRPNSCAFIDGATACEKKKRGPRIDLNDAIPLFFCNLFQWPAHLTLHATGVIDQDMHGVFSGKDALNEGEHGCAIPYIDSCDFAFAAGIMAELPRFV